MAIKIGDPDNVDWWPDHIVHVFKFIGRRMRSKRLYPADIVDISTETGAIIPDHSVKIVHQSAKERGWRRGRFVITIEGSRISGAWYFRSGELERLVINALATNAQTSH